MENGEPNLLELANSKISLLRKPAKPRTQTDYSFVHIHMLGLLFFPLVYAAGYWPFLAGQTTVTVADQHPNGRVAGDKAFPTLLGSTVG